MAKAMEEQVDAELHKLENLNEDDIDTIRARRMAEMKKRQEKSKEWLAKGHGEYVDLQTEKEFFDAMKGEEKMVCHFYRENWPCKVMDKHLAILAKKHIETKFAKINAEKSPFLTERLKIWMLPTLAIIKNEKTTDYVVGFDDLGGVDDFQTDLLAQRLAKADVIDYDWGRGAVSAPAEQAKGIRKSVHRTESDEDSDFD